MNRIIVGGCVKRMEETDKRLHHTNVFSTFSVVQYDKAFDLNWLLQSLIQRKLKIVL